jgi:hypothetical protein
VRITGVWNSIRKCSLQNFGKYYCGEKPYIEKITGDNQNVFRDGISATDNIFVLKIINEKTWEYKQSEQYLFINFQKAFNTIHRDKLWKCMEELKIPKNLIKDEKCCENRRNTVILF